MSDKPEAKPSRKVDADVVADIESDRLYRYFLRTAHLPVAVSCYHVSRRIKGGK